jgi:mRNA-degrading endonuclease RelE of RelBE toxin-antitoxin system
METRFKIEYSNIVANNHFDRLPYNIRHTIKKAIELKLGNDPIAFGKPLRYSFKGHRRLRVEDYRVIYRVNINTCVVSIVAIMHRKDIYERELIH